MSTITTKSLTVSIPNELINSSPETIVAWLNEQTVLSSSVRKNYNQKRLYPFWQVCPACSNPFAVMDWRQFYKKTTCGQLCGNRLIGIKAKGRNLKPIAERKGKDTTCPQCGKVTWKYNAQLRKSGEGYCSKSCRAKHVTTPLLIKNKFDRTGMKFPNSGLKGALNPAWKGGVTYFRKHGNYSGVKYVRCPKDYLEMARKDGYVMEHRLFVAQAMGRCLLRSEVVHHVNHDPTDNRIENLQLFATNQAHKLFEHHGIPFPIWRL